MRGPGVRGGSDIRRDRLDPVWVGPWSGLDSGRVFGLSDFFFIDYLIYSQLD